MSEKLVNELSGGVIGALNVLAGLIESDDNADKYMNLLKEEGVIGSDIWILYKDVCGENIKALCKVFNAVLGGAIPRSRMVELSKDQSRRANFTEDEWTAINSI